MRSKKFVCKMTAAFLSAAMVVASAPMYGQTRVSATEMEQVQNEFSFGSAQTKLSVGKYELPMTLMKADNSQPSMAGTCIKRGELTVDSDGTAEITVYLQAVTVMGISDWASGWNIYTGTLDGEKTAATYTQDGEGNVNSITFSLPNNSMDGVYVDMYISAMNSTQQAYLAFDFASLVGDGSETSTETKSGSAKVEQFGGYDVNVEVSILNNIIKDLEIEGANFGGTSAAYNESQLQKAADGMQPSYIGKSATDVKEIEGVDAVSGATVSSEAIRSAVINALELTPSGETITLPTEQLEEGTYQVDIAFYTDNVKHSLVENDKAKATITVDADGNMTLTTAVINGTEKEPLYFYKFNGYYAGNDVNGTLKPAVNVKEEDTDYTDDVFKADETVVTEVSFPLEGGFAEEYVTSASIYVPAMKNLNGEVGGIEFKNGRFTTDCFAKIYWDSLKKAGGESGFGSQETALGEGIYTLPVSMKKAEDTSANSMAGACLQGAALSVKADGSAIVTINLRAVTVGNQTAWSSEWKIYQGQSTDGNPVDAEVTKTDADGNVTQIAFTLPSNQADGVYVSMSSGGHANNAYLAFDYANAEKITYGSQGTALGEGIYTLPVSMKKAEDTSANSMAGACLQGAALSVKADGSAIVTINLRAVTVGNQTAWSSEWKIYQGQSTDGDPVDAEVTKTDADGNVTQIAFTLPNNQADGVYVNMSSGGHENNAYLAFDFANAEKQEKDPVDDPDNALEDGIYRVEGTMYKPDLKTKSMADTAFNHNIMMTVENGKATLTINFKGMEITSIYGYLGSMKYYDTGYQKDANGNPTGTLKEVTVESVQKYSDGVVISDGFGTDYPDVVSFEMIPEALEDGIVPLQVFVPIMESITEGTGNQNVYLSLNLDTLEKTTAEDELFKETETAPENPDSKTDVLDDGIYVVEGTMYKPDLNTKSMADAAFNHNIMLTVEDEEATLTLNFKGMEITSIYGYLGSLKYFDTGYQKDTYGNPTGTLKNVNVKSVQKYSDGVVISDDFGTNYPDVVSFEMIPEALEDGIVPLRVFVPIMESITEGTGNQNVYLSLDLETLEKTTAEDERFKDTEAAPVNPSQPTPPATPSQPSVPVIPSQPSAPGTPSQPSAPGTPPSQPTNTGNQSQPTDTGNQNQSTSSNPVTIKVGQTAKVSGHTYKVTAKGKVAFTKCKANAKTVTIPATIKIKGVTHKVTSIAKNAFKNNKKLTKVTVGKNVTKVGSNAFKGCTKLKTVKLAKSITKKKKTALKKLLKKAGVSAKAIK